MHHKMHANTCKNIFRNSVKDVGNADRYNINDLINKANTYDPNLKEYDIILVGIFYEFLTVRYSE